MLASLGLNFTVAPAAINEAVLAGEDAAAYVQRIAAAKANVVAARYPQALVIGCDTAVVVGAQILGKPQHRQDAERMLALLSDTSHWVMTALVLVGPVSSRACLVKTNVRFADLSNETISAYCDTDEPYDKAGAYAIQGFAQRFIRAIDGSYSSVVGFPLCELRELLEQEGFRCGFCEQIM